MSIPLFIADAFADGPFTGNPAAVCLLDAPRPDDWLQKLAGEMNLSETAYPIREGDGWRLRWFTPTVEVDLCGHATLATAHVLWQAGRCPPDESIRFASRSGPLVAHPDADGVALDFPALIVRECPPPTGLIEGLGVRPRFVGFSGMDYLVEVADEAALRGLRPDYGLLATVPTRGIIATCRSDEAGFDIASRFFAPAVGVNEDPVCGSSHCALGTYWAERLERIDLVARPASRRGGRVRVGVRGDRVRLAGRATVVVRGELAGEGSTS